MRDPEGVGARVLYIYESSIAGFVIRTPDQQTLDSVFFILRFDPRVAFIEQDKVVVPFSEYMPTGLKRVDGDRNNIRITNGFASLNASIAILDSGIDIDNPDLNVYRNVVFAQNAISADDICGHGTQVAGITSAKNNTMGILGMAPGARLWSVKVLELNYTSGKCEGSVSSTIAGVEYVTKHAREIDVANAR